MAWYSYILFFFGGAFGANGIPHFVNGISGQPFPTPFASPPGVGDSPPMVNVLWGAANMVISYFLLRAGRRKKPIPDAAKLITFLGFLLTAVLLAGVFSGRN